MWPIFKCWRKSIALQLSRNKRNTHEEYSHHHICKDGWDYHCHNKAQQTRTYKQEAGKFECLSRMPWRGEGSTHFLLDESLLGQGKQNATEQLAILGQHNSSLLPVTSCGSRARTIRSLLCYSNKDPSLLFPFLIPPVHSQMLTKVAPSVQQTVQQSSDTTIRQHSCRSLPNAPPKE